MIDPLSLRDITTEELVHWLENCQKWLERETGAVAEVRRGQIWLLEGELRRRRIQAVGAVTAPLRKTP